MAGERPFLLSVRAPRTAYIPLGRTGFRLVSDLILAIGAVAIVYFMRFNVLRGILPAPGPPDVTYYQAAAFPLAGCLILVFAATGVYHDRQRTWFVDELFAVWRALFVAAVFVLATTSLYRDPIANYSRLTFGLWVVVAGLLVGLSRYAIRRYERTQLAQGFGVLNVLIVGHGSPAKLLNDRIRMFPDCGYRIIGSVIRSDDIAPADVPLLGYIDNIRQIALDNGVNSVFIADRDATPDEIVELAGILADLPIEIRILPRTLDIIVSSAKTNEVAGLPLLTLKNRLDGDPLQFKAKRAVDIILAGLGIICLSPVMLILAVVIRTTSTGPALVHQDRVGLGGKVFGMHKFRSMRFDAEVNSGPVWSTVADPRRTSVGKFIRRFSIDELPQLWNVLVGEMSLVGPRPERPFFVEQLASKLPLYRERLRLRPGLTGWAQLNDLRGLTPIEERLVYDLYYIERWGITFDLKIILTTMFRVAMHKNAS